MGNYSKKQEEKNEGKTVKTCRILFQPFTTFFCYTCNRINGYADKGKLIQQLYIRFSCCCRNHHNHYFCQNRK